MTATTTLIGNTAQDVELRFTQNGKAVANLTIAVNDRKFDRTKNEYVDGDTWFARCTLWGELAEHAAQSLTKGTRVIAHGRIVERSFEDKDGNQRRSVEVTVESIGADLRYATAQITRSTGNQSQSRTQQQPVQQDSQVWGAPVQADPYAAVAADAGYQKSEVPF